MSTPSFLFFDCWYTLFTADLFDDLVRITALLDIPYDKAFVKAFERAFMIIPELDQTLSATRLMADLDLPTDHDTAVAIAGILREGFSRQRPYDDTFQTLEHLRSRYRIGIISNSSRAAFEHLMRMYNLKARFDVIVPSYEVGAIKPNPRIFRYALAKAEVDAADAIMIGDSPSDDYAGAREAGMSAILIDRRQRHPSHNHRIVELSQLESALTSRNI